MIDKKKTKMRTYNVDFVFNFICGSKNDFIVIGSPATQKIYAKLQFQDNLSMH